MATYEDVALKEMLTWQLKMMRKSSILGRAAKALQEKIKCLSNENL